MARKVLFSSESRPKISLAFQALFGKSDDISEMPTESENKEIEELLKQVDVKKFEDEVSNEGKKIKKSGNFGSSLKVEEKGKPEQAKSKTKKEVSKDDDLIK